MKRSCHLSPLTPSFPSALPFFLTQSFSSRLPPSTPAILGHSQTLKPAQISQPLPFLLSAWAPLPPDFHLEHPFIPCMALFKCHLLCETFSGCKIYSYSLHNKTSSPFPPLFFFNALLLHKQSIFHQEVEES